MVIFHSYVSLPEGTENDSFLQICWYPVLSTPKPGRPRGSHVRKDVEGLLPSIACDQCQHQVVELLPSSQNGEPYHPINTFEAYRVENRANYEADLYTYMHTYIYIYTHIHIYIYIYNPKKYKEKIPRVIGPLLAGKWIAPNFVLHTRLQSLDLSAMLKEVEIFLHQKQGFAWEKWWFNDI